MSTSETTTRSSGFTIHGDFITSIVREYVFEGAWRKGYDFLMDSLAGIDSDTVLDILKGKAKLEGVNEVEVVADDQEAEVAQRMERLYGRCFSFEGKLWRPYGYVDTFCKADMDLAVKIARGEDEQLLRNRFWRKAKDRLSPPETSRGSGLTYHKELALRPYFYLDDRSRDIVVEAPILHGRVYPVLCEMLEVDLPLWLKPTQEAQRVILEAYNAGKLRDAFEEHHPELSDADPPLRAFARVDKVESAAERKAREDAEDAAIEAADEAEREQVERWRNRIKEEADRDTDYGWLELAQYDKQAGRQVTLKVPHRAFICAALDRAKARDLMPAYTPVCPSGLKMANDDRYHTDSWLGAGLPLDKAYDDAFPEQRLYMNELYALQRKLLSQNFDVLARGKEHYFSGPVVHDPELADKASILVLKSAAPQYAEAALRSKAVIVETGSQLAHLVIVSREAAVPVVRVENALKLFPLGSEVFIDFGDGTVERRAY